MPPFLAAESHYALVHGLDFHKVCGDRASGALRVLGIRLCAGGRSQPTRPPARPPTPPQYYFNVGAKRDPGAPRSASTIANPDVRLLSPKVALVAYDRIVQRPDGSTAKFGETRVWAVQGPGAGRWQQVHFHRTPQN